MPSRPGKAVQISFTPEFKRNLASLWCCSQSILKLNRGMFQRMPFVGLFRILKQARLHKSIIIRRTAAGH
jgi:hypothetical protein